MGQALSSSSVDDQPSTRIARMLENRSNCRSDIEFDIEYSIDHWSELATSDTDMAPTSEEPARRTYFEELQKNPQWGGFFKDVKAVKLGEKINVGAQAEIYDAEVEFADGEQYGFGYHVVKLMKGDNPLQDFQRQWPVGMLANFSKDKGKGPLLWIKGGALIKNRFGFVMVRQWGDLRKLIDLKMRLNKNQRGPFAENMDFVIKVMISIARDMDKLHSEYGIVHRDLKASNVLLWSSDGEEPDKKRDVKASVVDYECSVGVMGTGFWRAPEILQQLKDGVPRSAIEFLKTADVYSYGMTCYELLTGCIPFEGEFALLLRNSTSAYDDLKWPHPDLEFISMETKCIVEVLRRCLIYQPSERPTFSWILGALNICTKYHHLALKKKEAWEKEAWEKELEEAWEKGLEAWKKEREEARKKEREAWKKEREEAWKKEREEAWKKEREEAWKKEREEARKKEREAWKKEREEAWKKEREEAWKKECTGS